MDIRLMFFKCVSCRVKVEVQNVKYFGAAVDIRLNKHLIVDKVWARYESVLGRRKKE